jgi:phosphatidylglycerophosphatase A
MLRTLANWISSGCGSGYALIAPGTFGSVAALIFWWLLFGVNALSATSSTLALAAATSCVGTVAVAYSMRFTPDISDPQWIVIDEWAGLFIALVGLTPSNWMAVLVAFILFRVLDATKLGPVAWAEQLPGAYGVMADDIVAGILTAGSLAICRACGII